MIILNAVMCTVHGYNVFTWQYWVWDFMIMFVFIAGDNWHKKGQK